GMSERNRGLEDGDRHAEGEGPVLGPGVGQGDARSDDDVGPLLADLGHTPFGVALLRHPGIDETLAGRPHGCRPGIGGDPHPGRHRRPRRQATSHPAPSMAARSLRRSSSVSRKLSTVTTTGTRPSNSAVCSSWPITTSAGIDRADEASVAVTRARRPSSSNTFSAVIRRMRLVPIPTPHTVRTVSSSTGPWELVTCIVQIRTGMRSCGAGALGTGCRRVRPRRPAMAPAITTAAMVSQPKQVTKASSKLPHASGWWMNSRTQLMMYQSGSARVASSGAVCDSSVQVTAWPTARKAPVMAPPRTAAFQPPCLLPNTPAAPPGKNSMIIGGTITIQSMAAKNAIRTRNMAVADRKPIITDDGDDGNTVGQSRAGRAPGMTRSLMPLKAGTTSARNIRTPKSRMAIPAANLSDWTTPHTQGFMSVL